MHDKIIEFLLHIKAGTECKLLSLSKSTSAKEYKISKPLTHNKTKTLSKITGNVNVPETAIKAAAGAIPKANPKTKWHRQETRFIKLYPSRITKAGKDKIPLKKLIEKATQTNKRELTITKISTLEAFNLPAGIYLIAVLGFNESISISIYLLTPIASFLPVSIKLNTPGQIHQLTNCGYTKQ